MTDFEGVTSLVILAATLVGILWRPRGISEAWIAAAGAVAMVLIGPMPLADLPDLVRSTADVLLFLTGMMLLTVLVEQAGVFDVLAEGCARLARGSGIVLFCLVFLLGAVITALLSLISIASGISAVPMLAAIATIVLLFVGGANDWFARRKPATYGDPLGGTYGSSPYGS